MPEDWERSETVRYLRDIIEYRPPAAEESMDPETREQMYKLVRSYIRILARDIEMGRHREESAR